MPAQPRATGARRGLRAYFLLLATTWLAACAATAPLARPAPAATLPTAQITLATSAPRAAAPTITPAPTPAPPTPTPQPWRFVVLGDIRTEGLKPPPITDDLVARATAAQPAITLVLGDMINALGTQAEVRQQWQFLRAALAPLGQAAGHAGPWLLATPGNHDVQGHRWATDLLVEAFPELPENGPPGMTRRAYAVDYRGVRFISLDSERFDAMHLLDDTQLVWLETQLRDNPNRFTIVFSHDPAFPAGPHVGSSLDAYPQARDRFWQLLRDYHASAYFAGHEHLYNRQTLDGVTQIIAGASGSSVYAGYGGEFEHYLVGEVGAETITLAVYDQQGQQRDRFTLP